MAAVDEPAISLAPVEQVDVGHEHRAEPVKGSDDDAHRDLKLIERR
jgi:hypothetical protein